MALIKPPNKLIRQLVTAISGGQTVFTFPLDVPADVSSILVFVDGIGITSDFSVSGVKEITLDSGVAIGTDVEVVSGGLISNISAAGIDGSIQFATSGSLNSNAAELFWDNSTQRMGIGTATPTSPLHVVGDTKITGDVFMSPTQKLYLDDGSNTYLSQVSADNMNFVTGGTERMRINNTGVGIGEPAPSVPLDVRVVSTDGIRVGDGTDYFGIQFDATNDIAILSTNNQTTQGIWLKTATVPAGGLILSNVDTNNTDKGVLLLSYAYVTAQDPVCIMDGFFETSNNTIQWGGGVASTQAATIQNWVVAATVNSAGSVEMTLDSTGFLGLGVAVPEVRLHVVGGVKITGDVFLGSAQKLYFDGGSNSFIHQITGDNIAVVTGGSERVRINNAGVGFGTTNPEEALHVVGNFKITGDIFLGSTNKLFLDGGSNTFIYQVSGDVIDFVTGGSSRVSISTTTFDAAVDINVGVGMVYKQSGNSGFGGNGTTLTFGGGSSGEVATLTVAGGIITARTLVP